MASVKAKGLMCECVGIGLCHMAPEVGCPDPSSMTSLKAPWLAVLIADGDDPSIAFSEKIIWFSRPALHAKSSSSIGLLPAKGLANCLKGDCGWARFPLKWCNWLGLMVEPDELPKNFSSSKSSGPGAPCTGAVRSPPPPIPPKPICVSSRGNPWCCPWLPMAVDMPL